MTQYRCGPRKQSVKVTVDALDSTEQMYQTMHSALTWGLLVGGICLGLVLGYIVGSFALKYINRLRKESMEMYTIPNKDIRITPTLTSPVDR